MVLKQSFKYTLFNLNSMHFVYAKVREIAQTPTYSIFQSNGFGYEFWDLKPNQKSSILVCFPLADITREAPNYGVAVAGIYL